MNERLKPRPAKKEQVATFFQKLSWFWEEINPLAKLRDRYLHWKLGRRIDRE